MILRESPDWSGLEHAYGPADDVPALLARLRGADWEDAVGELAASILHQGSVYPATVAALPFLVEIARDPGAAGRVGAAWLLGSYVQSIAMGASRAVANLPDGIDVDAFDEQAHAARDAVALGMLPLLTDPVPDVRETAYGATAHLAGTAVTDEVVAVLRTRLDSEDHAGAAVALMEPLVRLGAFDQADLAAVVARGDDAVAFAAVWSVVAARRDLPGAVGHLVRLWPGHAGQYPSGDANTSLRLLAGTAGAHAIPVLLALQAARAAPVEDLADGWVALAVASRSGADPALDGLLDLATDPLAPELATRLVQALARVLPDLPGRTTETCDAVARIASDSTDATLLAHAAVALFTARDERWAAPAFAVLAASASEPKVANDTATMPFSLGLLGFPAHRRATAWAARELADLAVRAVAAWPRTVNGWVEVLAELPVDETVVRGALAATAEKSAWKLLSRIVLDHPGVLTPDLREQIEAALDATQPGSLTAWHETTRALLAGTDAFERVWELNGGDADLLALWVRRSSPAAQATCLRLLDGTAHRSISARRCQLVAARAVTDVTRAWPTVCAVVDNAGAPIADGVQLGNRIVAADGSLRAEWVDLLRDIAVEGREDWSGVDHWSSAVALEALHDLGELTAGEAARAAVGTLLASIPSLQAARVAPVAARVLRTALTARPDLRDDVARRLAPVLDTDSRVQAATETVTDDALVRTALRDALA